MTYRITFADKEIFRFVVICLSAAVFGVLNLGLLPVQAQTNTSYVDGTNGNDNNNGSAQTPWKTVQKAINTISPGSTVIIRSGIYRVDEVLFGPAGTGANARTIFKALPGERVIFSRVDNLTPHIMLGDYVRIENLWFGGNWDRANNGGLFQPGGSPIGTGKQIINCTIFGYQVGINIGSSQNLLLQGNRLVHNGNGDFDHGMYISGGGPPGSMSNHIIIDNNIVILGQGYAIHGWHGPRTIVVTRNFVSDHMYGLVMGGQGEAYDHLIANNIIWKEPNRGAQLPGTNTTFINNVMGPNTGIIEDYKATNLIIKNDAFWDTSPGTRGINSISLNSGLTQSALGLSDAQIDGAIAALDGSFNQSVQAIFADSTIEANFQRLHSFNIPLQSPLHQAGINWMGGGTGLDLGTGIQVPVDEMGFWTAFRGMGLREYDRFGNLQSPSSSTSTPVPPTVISTNTASSTLTKTPTGQISTSTSVITSTSPTTNTPANLACPCSLWGTPVPATPAYADSAAVELGVRFQSSIGGYITGLRFYKGSSNTGTHVGHLWTGSGSLLAQATFSNETASGWQTVSFATPVAIAANTVYVASYYAPNGNYAVNRSYFNSAFTNGPLTAVASNNGVYGYGALGTYPSNSYQATNYWVDVVFSNIIQSSATSTNTNTPTATLRPITNTPTFTSTPQPITNTPTSTSTPRQVTNTPTKTSVPPSITAPANVGCPCSLWATPIPATSAQPDNAAVEVGVRFQSNITGYITGIRFYKGNTNTGTHVGHLWNANGALLAQATFTGETASGWQVVTFASPIAITANTVYVASYYAPRGNYAVSRNYFTAAYSRGPLTALATTNGVYGYGSLGTFPRGTYQATNYWVDVIFSNTLQTGAPVAYVTTNTPIPPSSTLAELTFTSTPLPTLTPTTVTNDMPALVVGVSNETTTTNNTVAVNLNLKNVNNVYGLEVTCQIDPTVLIGKSHSDTTGFNQSNSFIIDTGFNSADGTWHLAASRLRPNPAITGNDVAFSLNYDVLSAGSTSINCSAIAADINGMELALQVINGAYGNTMPPISPTDIVVPPTQTSIPTLIPVTETLVPTDEVPTSVPVSKSIISGIVNYPATTNHAGITVTLLAADSSVLSQIVTIVDGAYSFKDIPIGAYTVQYTTSRSLTIRRIVLVESDGKSIDLGVTMLLMGDTDGNDTIDLNDAVLIGANFGINVPPAPNQVDLNADGLINIVDLTLMGTNFNISGPVMLN